MKILNWKKYQGREVKTRSSWLRFENNFIESPNFGEFTSEERIVWIYVLCCASKLNNDVLRVPHQVSHRVLHRCIGIDENVFHRAIEKLKKIQLVEIRTTRGRHADDTSVNADDTLRDVDETLRNETETRRDETKDFSGGGSGEPPTAAIACYRSLESVFRERKVSEGIQLRWTEAFPESEWVVEEIRKALVWESATPLRRKKNFAAFISRWLTKGWDFRKTSPAAPKTDWSKVFGKGEGVA